MLGNHLMGGKRTNGISFICTVPYLWVLFGLTWRTDQSLLIIILPLFPSTLGNAIFSHSIDEWRKMFHFCPFWWENMFPIEILPTYNIGDIKLIIFNVLRKCLFHLLSSVFMFIYAMLFRSSLHCTLSADG